MGGVIVQWNSVTTLVGLCTFLVHTRLLGRTLSASQGFTSLSLFGILRFPLLVLPDVVNFYLQVCLPAFVLVGRDGSALSVPSSGHIAWPAPSHTHFLEDVCKPRTRMPQLALPPTSRHAHRSREKLNSELFCFFPCALERTQKARVSLNRIEEFLGRRDIEGQPADKDLAGGGDAPDRPRAPVGGLLVQNGTFAWPQTVSLFPGHFSSAFILART